MSKILASNILCNLIFVKKGMGPKRHAIVRPFPIMENANQKQIQAISAAFPGEYKAAIPRAIIKYRFPDIEEKALFVKSDGGDFRYGLYKGNILDVGADHYYVFEVKESFPKAILLPRMHESMAMGQMILTISTNSFKFYSNSYLKYDWKDSIEDNIHFIEKEIEKIRKSLWIVSWPSKEEIETFARAQELFKKIHAMNNPKKFGKERK
jgi:hypothetical protein